MSVCLSDHQEPVNRYLQTVRNNASRHGSFDGFLPVCQLMIALLPSAAMIASSWGMLFN